MLCLDGKLSLRCYLVAIVTFSFLFLIEYNWKWKFSDKTSEIVAIIGYIAIYNAGLYVMKKSYHYEVAVRATFLGFVFAVGLYIFKEGYNGINIFGIYMCIMSVFHYSEYLFIAIIQPKELGTNSFLLYHSNYYVIAAISSWVEFFIETYLCLSMKQFNYLTYFGVFVCIVGEFMRKLAMITAKSNFNHLVQYTKAKDHVLVTNGIYSLCRHPSYVGWFYWSIGTQLILLNPFCLIAYTLASWAFFNERIKIEEITLINFFGQQYCDYQQQVGTGLPFINGYVIKS